MLATRNRTYHVTFWAHLNCPPQITVPSGMMLSLMITTMPSLMTKPRCSWFDSRTSSLLRILTLLPMRAFLSMMALRTWVLAPAEVAMSQNQADDCRTYNTLEADMSSCLQVHPAAAQTMLSECCHWSILCKHHRASVSRHACTVLLDCSWSTSITPS